MEDILNEKSSPIYVGALSFEDKDKKLKDDFKLFKERKAKSSSSNVYNTAKKVIYFYEWSDLGREPLLFEDTNKFFQFLDECNIQYTERQKNSLLASSSERFTSCKKDKNILQTSYSKFVLENYINNPNECDYLSD